MKRICIVFLMFLGMVSMNALYAQKPLAAMTKTEINALSDAQIKKEVIKDWGSFLSFMIRGVKFDDRIVNIFAENFKEGALNWTKMDKYPTVDYVIAVDLVQFKKMWYDGINSCKMAVIALNKKVSSNTIEDAMMQMWDATFVYERKQKSGQITQTPPEYVDAISLINSMEP